MCTKTKTIQSRQISDINSLLKAVARELKKNSFFKKFTYKVVLRRQVASDMFKREI